MSFAAVVTVVAGFAWVSNGQQPSDGFEKAAGVFVRRCYECHNNTEKSGGLDLSTREGAFAGGENGAVIVPGRADESLLLDRLKNGEMPPKKSGKSQHLTSEEISAIETWIASGADWPSNYVLDPFVSTTERRAGRDFWSLQPIKPVALPEIQDVSKASNPIDRFLIHELEKGGWKYAPLADRRTLIRRVSIDLVGLNPTYEEVEAFANDNRPDAYERLIDRLLASPHYGERWGRHWLDIVRYADTCGYERDQSKPGVWRYRDWVIGAFNADMPYDQFVMAQLAGDERPKRTEADLIATGFIRLGTWNDEPNDPQEYKYERLEDMVHATSTAFLAMTVKCARCHDHKFDPILQSDYYRLAAAFWSGPIEPGPREWLGGPDPKTLPPDLFAWTDVTRNPPPLRLLKKGDPNKPGPVIAPGQLSMVPHLDRPLEGPPAHSATSQRRTQLAQWIIDPTNPLTPRVWVNRVWQYHFGEGLVRSPDNFGFNGDRPTHPELLDYLAGQLLANNWQTKPLHRLILSSHAYQQASVHPSQSEYEQQDAANRHWWRAERRRLDAETLRDALLSASRALDLSRLGGAGFTPDVAPEALEGLSMKDKAWTPSPPAEQRRRSVYMFAKRGLLAPLMTTFDAPDTTLPCGRRDVTLVAPQALSLFNNAFVHEQSRLLAHQIAASHSSNESRARILAAWRSILARNPTSHEFELAERFIHEQRHHDAQASTEPPDVRALAALCHVLLNSNEFIYVD